MSMANKPSTNKAHANSGRGAAWLARLLWEQEVGSSNLLAPTHKAFRSNELQKAFFFVMISKNGLCYAGATLAGIPIFYLWTVPSHKKTHSPERRPASG